MQIQISWLLKKPTDLDLHCLQRQGISGFSRTRVKLTMEPVLMAQLDAHPNGDQEVAGSFVGIDHKIFLWPFFPCS